MSKPTQLLSYQVVKVLQKIIVLEMGFNRITFQTNIKKVCRQPLDHTYIRQYVVRMMTVLPN